MLFLFSVTDTRERFWSRGASACPSPLTMLQDSLAPPKDSLNSLGSMTVLQSTTGALPDTVLQVTESDSSSETLFSTPLNWTSSGVEKSQSESTSSEELLQRVGERRFRKSLDSNNEAVSIEQRRECQGSFLVDGITKITL